MANVLIPIAVGFVVNTLMSLLTPVQRQSQEGSRLDTQAPRSEYGYDLADFYGVCRVNALSMFWALPLKKVVTETQQGGGKGGGGGTVSQEYSYYLTAAFLIGGGILYLDQLTVNGRVVDIDSNYIEVYTGTTTQNASPTISAIEGTIPAFRGSSYIVFKEYPVESYGGGGFPKVDARVVGKGSTEPAVKEVIADICERAGLTPSEYNVDGILSEVKMHGLQVRNDGSKIRDALEDLMRGHFIVCRESRRVVYFYKDKPSTPVRVVHNAAFGARSFGSQSESRYEIKTVNRKELPSDIQIEFQNIDNNHDNGLQQIRDPLAAHENQLNIRTELVATDSEMQSLASKLLFQLLIQRTGYEKITLLPAWSDIMPADIVDFRIKGTSHLVQIKNRTISPNYLISLEGNLIGRSNNTQNHLFGTYFAKDKNFAVAWEGWKGDANNPSTSQVLRADTTRFWRTVNPVVGQISSPKFIEVSGEWKLSITRGVLYEEIITQYDIVDISENDWQSRNVNTITSEFGQINPIDIYGATIVDTASHGGALQLVDILPIEPSSIIYPDLLSDYNYELENTQGTYTPPISPPAPPYQPPTPTPSTAAELIVCDISLVRDSDAEVGLYVAINSNTAVSGAIAISYDAGATYQIGAYYTSQSTIGTANTILPTGVAGVPGTTTTLSVTFSSGAPEGVTESVFLADRHLFLVGSEIVAFRDATLTAANTYTLSRDNRGRRGTEGSISGHIANERVVALSQSVIRIKGAITDIGRTLRFKLIPSGFLETSITYYISHTVVGNSLKPYSVTSVQAVKDTNDNYLITWIARSRGAGLTIGEETENYEVEIYNAAGTILERTISSTTPSVIYSKEQQLIDNGAIVATLNIKIFKMSAHVGRGFEFKAFPLTYTSGTTTYYGDLTSEAYKGTKAISANYTLLEADNGYWFLVDTALGNITVTVNNLFAGGWKAHFININTTNSNKIVWSGSGATFYNNITEADARETAALFYHGNKNWSVNFVAMSGGSGGAVDSVNGETGVVVLDATDIAETTTRKWLSDSERTKLTGIEAGATADQTATEIRNALATLTTTNRLGASSIKDLTNQTAAEVRDSLETLSGVNRLDAAFVDGLGTAAFVDVGTGANQVVVLTAAAKLPAVDGSLLTNIPGGSEWALSGTVSSSFTAVSGTRYPCSTVGGTFTVTLPTSGRVWLFDAAGNSSSTGFGTNLLTVTPTGGQTIMGSGSLSLNRGAIGAILELISSDWRVLNAR